jgi:hypothetical protein
MRFLERSTAGTWRASLREILGAIAPPKFMASIISGGMSTVN